jgi:hypothetical protein
MIWYDYVEEGEVGTGDVKLTAMVKCYKTFHRNVD